MSQSGPGSHALLISHQYWPTPGAASQRMGALVRELRGRGITVTVLANATTRSQLRELTGPHGETVLAVAGPESSGVSASRMYELFRFAFSVFRRGVTLRPTVVVSDAPPTAAWAAARVSVARGVPFVYYFSDSWGAASREATSRVARTLNSLITRIETSALKSAKLAIGVTEEMVEIARGAGCSQVDFVPNGVDTAQLNSSQQLWFPRGEPRPFFLYAGNAGVVHGAEVFPEGAEILWKEGMDFDLVFMGYGGTHSYLEGFRSRWGDRVISLPNQPTDTVASAFRASAGALSSLRPMPSYAHARPIKSMTGAACGAPAVYVGTGDFAEMVARESLGFVAPWSAAGAASAMRSALDIAQREGYGAYRERIRAYALAHFDVRHGAAQVAEAVESVCL